MCQNEELTRAENVIAVCNKINLQFKKWSRRNLSILGKILIVKTFGISQVIYLFQSMLVNEPEIKKINQFLYKFIWNRHYLAAKAPERLKREIVNKPIKQGGLGMLDVSELDASLKLKALGRLANSNHPMLSILRTCIRNDFFFPEVKLNLDGVLTQGINLLRYDRQSLWTLEPLNSNRLFIKMVKETRLVKALSPIGRNSLAYLLLRTQNKSKLGELSRNDLTSIARFIHPNLLEAANRIRDMNPGQIEAELTSYFDGIGFTTLDKLTSKKIRQCRQVLDPICVLKLGPIISPNESINLFGTLAKLTNTRHKDIMLRLMHGELYSKEKLHRYGLVDQPLCPRCNNLETLRHKYLECSYVREIWRRTFELTNRLKTQAHREPLENQALNVTEPKISILTIHSEILLEIRRLKDDAPYQLLPKIIARKAIERLSRRENNKKVKGELCALLEETND